MHLFSNLFLTLALLSGLSSCDSPGKEYKTSATIELLCPDFATQNTTYIDTQISMLSEANSDFEIHKFEGSNQVTITTHNSLKDTGRKLIKNALESYENQYQETLPEKLRTLKSQIFSQSQYISELQRDSLLLGTTFPDFVGEDRDKLTLQQLSRQILQNLDGLEIQTDQIELQINKLSTLEGDQRLEYASSIETQGESVAYYWKHLKKTTAEIHGLSGNAIQEDDRRLLKLETESKSLRKHANLETQILLDNLNTLLNLSNRQTKKLRDFVMLVIEDRHGFATPSIMTAWKKRLAEHQEASEELQNLKAEEAFLQKQLESPKPPFTIQSWDHQ